MLLTLSRCPVRDKSCLPVWRSHTLMCRSDPPEKTRRPSAERATAATLDSDSRRRISCASSRSQRRITPSSPIGFIGVVSQHDIGMGKLGQVTDLPSEAQGHLWIGLEVSTDHLESHDAVHKPVAGFVKL